MRFTAQKDGDEQSFDFSIETIADQGTDAGHYMMAVNSNGCGTERLESIDTVSIMQGVYSARIEVIFYDSRNGKDKPSFRSGYSRVTVILVRGDDRLHQRVYLLNYKERTEHAEVFAVWKPYYDGLDQTYYTDANAFDMVERQVHDCYYGKENFGSAFYPVDASITAVDSAQAR